MNQTTQTNTVEENETNVENETDTENVVNEPVTPSIQPNVTEEEKVIELVKNEYGTDQGVTFNIANKEGTIYHVSVNDAETTAVLTWYTVDISTNTVTQ